MQNLNKLNKGIWLLITKIFFTLNFGHIGKKTIIFSPMRIDNPKSIHLDDNVFIAHNAWLMGRKDKEKTLYIGKNTIIGHYSHIVSYENIHIGNSVLIADKVFISDCTHNYEHIGIPIIDQPIGALKSVSIGDESWIGENVCIVGSKVGKHCVIGANSVVLHDIPDFSVAVGNPAKIVKKYSFEKKMWEKTSHKYLS